MHTLFTFTDNTKSTDRPKHAYCTYCSCQINQQGAGFSCGYLAWRGRVGEALVEAPQGRRACRCPGDVGLVDARENCLPGSPRRRVGRTPGDPALQGPRLDYLMIGRMDGCLSDPCGVASGFRLRPGGEPVWSGSCRRGAVREPEGLVRVV